MIAGPTPRRNPTRNPRPPEIPGPAAPATAHAAGTTRPRVRFGGVGDNSSASSLFTITYPRIPGILNFIMSYDFSDIESRWQQYWAEHETFKTANPGQIGFDPSRPKFYVLDMFPYPSGVGLHVGHPLGYIATDITARYKRMCGYNVLHPMGYDAFGLPAEQYAVETGTHPRETTENNIANMTRQLKRLGLSYDWSRQVATTDPGYYKWTQWVFLQLYHSYVDPFDGKAKPIQHLIDQLEGEELLIAHDGSLRASGIDEDMDALSGTPVGYSKWAELTNEQRDDLLDQYRLAYRAQVPVNWCPGLGTVLANEEVTNDGRSERGNYPVFRRPLKQWMLRITAMADRLEDDLERVDWPEAIKLMQRNWIGRSEGAAVFFPVAADAAREAGDDDEQPVIEVFTTRPDTLFGATYMVLAPEHPLVETIATAAQRSAVEAYQKEAARKAENERTAETRQKTGVFTGAYAINPVNNEKVPIWIADYVMMGYGTGAIMAVPAHDERDFEFAKTVDLPIRDVVYSAPLAAIHAFFRRHDAASDDDPQTVRMLIDFVGLCVNQHRTDYDEVYQTVGNRRERKADELNISSRGNIAMIWADTIAELCKGGVAPLRQAVTEGRLVELTDAAMTDPGVAAHSANDELSLNGLPTDEAKEKISDYLERKGIGNRRVNTKLRDWLFSRQRYWGEPFPIVHDARGRVRPLDESELPVTLPEMEDFRPVAAEDPEDPTTEPQPPLGRAPDDWKNVQIDGQVYHRELNTMPQWAGSCWYYLRFLDPDNSERLVDPEVERYWMKTGKDSDADYSGGVDLYVGGAEHAVLHLLYARFWHKVLFDLGHVSTPEPFGRLYNQGYIQAPYYEDERGVRLPADEIAYVGEKATHEGKEVKEMFGKMGKSLKNAIAPDAICEEYGCDTLRLYEMYMGPLDQSKVWQPRDIIGLHKFLQRMWRNFVDEYTDKLKVSDTEPAPELERKLHATLKRCTEAMDSLSFNVAIAALIELNNALVSLSDIPRKVAEPMTLALAPLAPHIAEELWQRLGKEHSLAYEDWPLYDQDKLVADTFELPVQVNGKLRGKITVPADADEAAAEQAAKADDNVAAHLEGKTVRKVIVIPGKMVNIVVG